MSNIQRRRNPVSGPASFAKPPMAAVNTAGITPKEAMGIMRRHILMIIMFTLIGLIISGVCYVLTPAKFTARGYIEVLPPGEVDPFQLQSVQANKELYFQLRSTMALQLKNETFLRLALEKSNDIRNTKWFKRVGTTKTLSNIIKGSQPNQLHNLLEDLKDNLSVSPQRDNNMVLVSMTCRNNEDAKTITNEIMTRFASMRKIDNQGDTSDELRIHNARKQELTTSINKLETSLKSMRTNYPNFGNLEKVTFQDHLELSLGSIERQSDDLATQQSGLEEMIKNLQRRVDSDYDEVVRERIERDEIASNMRQRLSILETNLASLESRFGEGHRRVRQARDSIEQARKDLAFRQKEIGDIERNADLIRAQEQMLSLQAQIVETEKRLVETKRNHKNISNIRAEYDNILTERDDKKKESEEVTKFIEALTARYEDPKIAKIKEPLGFALAPLYKTGPQISLFIIGGFMLGLFAGAGLAFGKELLNDVLRSPSDVSKHLHVPLLGMISHTDEDNALGGVNIYHVVRQAPYSIMSECYRQLRTNLRLSEAGARHRSLLVTSCNSGCGKTTTATNLSATLVAEGMRVLLIDTNFRRPSLTGLFPRSEEEGASGGADSGLSNYLLAQCSLEDVCRESSIEDLDIIDAGPLPSNPSELLNNIKMTELINQANTTYDYVIIDGPPLIVSDAKILASQVDSTIVVFNAMSTRRGEAQRSLRELREINSDIAGTVLLGVRSMKGGYFQEVYKSYLQYQQVQLAGSVQ